jgi:hypothetical protein
MRKIHSMLIAALLVAMVGALQSPLPAQALSGAISFSPSYVYFSSTYVGEMSAPITVTVKNLLAWNLKIHRLTITGDFLLQNNGCTWHELTPGGTCTFSVIFFPKGTGNKTGTVTVANKYSSTDDKISLTGYGNGTNLLQAANFEYPFPKPLPWKDGSTTLKIPDALDCSVSVSPICSVKIPGTVLNTKRTISQAVAVNGLKGDKYNFLLFSKANDVPTGGIYYVSLKLLNMYNMVVGSTTVKFKPGAHDFQIAIGKITADEQYTWLVFSFTYKNTHGTVWFDNAVLIKVP